MTIVEESGGQYHVLLIIADGQVLEPYLTGEGFLASVSFPDRYGYCQTLFTDHWSFYYDR